MDKTTRIRRIEMVGIVLLLSFGWLICYAVGEKFHDPALIGNLRRVLADSKSDGDSKSSDGDSKSSDGKSPSSSGDNKASDAESPSSSGDGKAADAESPSSSGDGKASDAEAPSGDDKAPAAGGASGGDVFDVTKYGAVSGEKNNVQAFMKTWVAACKQGTGKARIVIPAGTFLVGPVVFQGPCKASPIVVEVQGTVKATTDVSEYSSPEWFSFEQITGLLITGKGTFDGQGPKVWKFNDCDTNPDCQHLAASFKFTDVKNAVVDGITSLDSKWFHFFVYRSSNFTFQNVLVTAPGDSPNTDGIHLSSATGVKILKTTIKTGDDCIAIVQDTHDVLVDGVSCGPGHGISIGSLGKWPADKGSTGIVVQNSIINGATNGARIKTWAGPTSGEASNIVFENIQMTNVKNPIIIDQNYGKYKDTPSKWKLSDIHFRKIKGTSASKVAVSLGCSSANPCDTVEMADIDLTFKGGEAQSVCANAKVKQGGTVKPVPCSTTGKPESGE